MRSAEILRDVDDNKQLAQLMTPYFERNYTDNEIEALTDFFGSSDGKAFTAFIILASSYRIDPQSPRSPQPIDADTQRRLNRFLQSGVGKKFSQLMGEYRQELDRQSSSYLCGIVERRGSSCAALGIGGGLAK